jgi:hypothetical protein
MALVGRSGVIVAARPEDFRVVLGRLYSMLPKHSRNNWNPDNIRNL